MKKLDVTENLIRELIEEVAPLVSGLTKWNLAIGSLGIRVLPKDRGYEEVLLGQLRGAGVNIDEDEPRSLMERMIEYVIEANVLGAYQSSTQKILIIRENVDESNLNGLKLVVAHELVHRGQHVNFAHLFDRVDGIIREIFYYLLQEGASLFEAMRKIDKVKQLMTVIESHAYYVQQLLQQSHFPDAKIESHFNFATLLMKLFGQEKISQYTEGIPQVKAAMASGDIDSLYRSL